VQMLPEKLDGILEFQRRLTFLMKALIFIFEYHYILVNHAHAAISAGFTLL